MSILIDVLAATWQVFAIASPFILIGLLAAGVLHELIDSRIVARWLGRPGFGSTFRAAAIGIPLPLCSCSVVPITIELSRKGASREASLAFLVSTPETGVDSILVTYGLMGPVMTVARPLAALATSIAAAAASIVAPGERPQIQRNGSAETASPERVLQPVSARIRNGLRYGFVEMIDEIGPWLVIGFVLTGLIAVLVPDEAIRGAFGGGFLAYIGLLLLGTPMYMCASASTPIAAALLMKGASPGATLVFLLAGPATNAASLVLIARFFGRRFVSIYLASVVVLSLVCGFLLDSVIGLLGWRIASRLGDAAGESVGSLELYLGFFLLLLLAGTVLRGSWGMAGREFLTDIRKWKELLQRNGFRDAALATNSSAATDVTGAALPDLPARPYSGRGHAPTVPGAPALLTSGLRAGYGTQNPNALHGIDLEIPPGARVAIVGPNGAGKSTLLKVVAGLLPASEGTIQIFGQPVGACHHRVAYLPQRSEIDWHFPMTVERLVLTGRYVHIGWFGQPTHEDRRIVHGILDSLGLAQLAEAQVENLSGGQQQRALLGRTLAQQADLVLLDEPLNAVDSRARAVIRDVLDILQSAGTTVLIATHDIGRMERQFDGALFLSEGTETAPPPGSFSGNRYGASE